MKRTIIIVLSLVLVLLAFTSCEEEIHVHTWDEGTVTKAATCSEKGVKTYTCTGCKETKTEDIAIDPDNHTWDEGKETTKATYLKKGIITEKCNKCGEEREIETPVIPIVGSSFIEIELYPDKSNIFDCFFYEFNEDSYTLYAGEGSRYSSEDNYSVFLQSVLSGTYKLNLDTEEISLNMYNSEMVYKISESVNEDGDVNSIALSFTDEKDNTITKNAIPIIINKTLESLPGWHFYNAKCDFKTSVPTGSESSLEIVFNTILMDPQKHIGNYTAVEGKTPGYFTKGVVDWDVCTVCGYDGVEEDFLLPLTDTTWISTTPVTSDIEGFKGKTLIIEFDEFGGATIKTQLNENIETVINTIERYKIVSNEAQMSIYLYVNLNSIFYYEATVEENIGEKTITFKEFVRKNGTGEPEEIGSNIVFEKKTEQ